MLYTQWVRNVLRAMAESQNVRTRVVGLPASGLRDTLGVDLSDADAIEDALYDLEALGLTRRRPSGGYNLTPLGSEAVARSIENVCGTAIFATCTALTDDQRRFLDVLTERSQTEYDGFVRARYINVDQVFAAIGLSDNSHEQQELFLLPLVESRCIDYQEYPSARSVRPLYTGIACTSGVRERTPTEASSSLLT